MRMFAVSAPGLEAIVASELHQMGNCDAAPVAGGVNFSGDLAQLYDANLNLRTASRIVVRVDEFHASSFHELERRAKRIRWDEYLVPGARVQFRVTCRKSRLYHSDAVAQRFSEAVAKQVQGVVIGAAAAGSADDSDVDVEDSTSAQLFTVRLAHDNCVVSVDSSGDLLHRRGYRQAIGKAPLRETLAAAMVLGSGWDGRSPFIDPMCGSGVIAIEAALIARQIPPGIGRAFAFQDWPSYDETLWGSVKGKRLHATPLGKIGAILASDRDDGVTKSAESNAARAGVTEDIQFESKPISAIEPPRAPGWIVTNPPYGVRVGDWGPLRNLYAQIGNVVREKARGYAVGLLTSDSMLESQLRLELEEVFRTRNGGIPVRFMKSAIP
jgi:putative N6-adenine-specific DNA methylase